MLGCTAQLYAGSPDPRETAVPGCRRIRRTSGGPLICLKSSGRGSTCEDLSVAGRLRPDIGHGPLSNVTSELGAAFTEHAAAKTAHTGCEWSPVW